MAEELLQDVNITDDYVLLKFQRSVKVSTITNDKFAVATDEATPQAVSSPFIDIEIADHYNSISRILELYWNDNALATNTDYTLTISGLEDVAGDAITPDSVITFTTGTTLEDDPEIPPTAVEFEIVDKSIDAGAFARPGILTATNTNFNIVSVEPENGSYYLEEDYNNGRVVIKFSNRVDNEFVQDSYFKVQRKLIQRAPTRWETLNALIYQDGSRPWVYVDLPSIDHWPEAATPSTATVWGEEGYYYYEPGYKYRIKISGEVST